MGDESFEDTLGNIFLVHRLGCARSLLSGNDTGCFTTEQYRRRFIEREPIDFPTWTTRIRAKIVTTETALAHCRRLVARGFIREVKPDVWAPTERLLNWEE